MSAPNFLLRSRFTSSPTLLRAAAGLAFAAVLVISSQQKGSAFGASFKWHADENYYYLESNGLPTHKMMVGIRAWQQQVPLPQDYTGDNAFMIPRHPIESDHPVDARSAMFSGAMSVAINGIPIFNPIKNDGKTDTFIAGELDDFGGHCGRTDDYHYHVAPLFLQDTVGKANPIAYGLDGYPIYGYEEPDGSPATGLDKLNGHKDAAGNYHYHSTKAYPYLNGGLHGNAKVVLDAVTPQPFARAVRQWLTPIQGARIIGFYWPSPNHYSLEYVVGNAHSFVNYSLNPDNTYTFNFVDPTGKTRTEVYQKKPTRVSSFITADYTGNLVVPVGKSVLYTWGSTSAKNGATMLQIYKSTNNSGPTDPVASDPCGTASGPYKAISGKSGAIKMTAAACSAGYTYKYVFTASTATEGASDEIFVTVTK